jgi:membrane-bound metal-dependent hydrolase YbcI (DUF457 family)
MALLCWPLVTPAGAVISPRNRLLLAGLVLFAVNAPDVDFLIELARGRSMAEGHGSYTHSLLAMAVFSVVFAAAARMLSPAGLVRLWVAGVVAYGSHLLLDAGNRGRGIALLWPWDEARYGLPVRIFVGVRHNDPWDWRHHLLTLGTELLFFALAAVVAYVFFRRHLTGRRPA